jgi:hypothetical protein
MKRLKHVVAAVIAAASFVATSARADLVYHSHIVGFNNGNIGVQETLVSGILGETLILIGRYDVSGSIDQNPYGLLPGNIQIQNILPAGDPETFQISWDLTGTGFELSAVLIKNGSAGSTLWTATDDQAITSGGWQDAYWGTSAGSENGSISHISIFGTRGTSQTPDGGATLMLFGAAVAGLGTVRRFIKL